MITTVLILPTKRIISCQTEGVILFKTILAFSDAEKYYENHLFTEKE